MISVRSELRGLLAKLLSSKWRRTSIEDVHIPLKLRIRRYLSLIQLATYDELVHEFVERRNGELRSTFDDAIKTMRSSREIAEVEKNGQVFIYPLKTERLFWKKDVARVVVLGASTASLLASAYYGSVLGFLEAVGFIIAAIGYIASEITE